MYRFNYMGLCLSSFFHEYNLDINLNLEIIFPGFSYIKLYASLGELWPLY